jgi:hypothetical protein
MATLDHGNEPQSEDVVFRPLKRRKYIRKRANDDEDVTSSILSERQDVETFLPPPTHLGDFEMNTDGSSEVGLSIADILRLRKAGRGRRAGIEFRVDKAKHDGSQSPQTQVARLDVEGDIVIAEPEGIINRFASQTGQVADADKHM